MTRLTKIHKKRHLLKRETPSENIGDDVCLSDITDNLLDLSKECAELEIKDNLTAASKAVKKIIEVERRLDLLKRRFKTIKHDIKSVRDLKHSGQPQYLNNNNK